MEDGGHGDLISNIESLNKQRHIYKMAGIMMHKLHKFFLLLTVGFLQKMSLSVVEKRTVSNAEQASFMNKDGGYEYNLKQHQWETNDIGVQYDPILKD